MLGASIRACALRLKPFLFKETEKAEVWDRKPWRETARPDQLLPEGEWTTWLILAGRGWGKTRTGAEAVIEEARRDANARIALVGRTAADVRDVMITGESGVLACSPPDFRPIYNSSKRKLTWPNGAIATAYSAEEPDQLRGPQHTFAWADELAAWFMGAKRGRNAKPNGTPEAWEQLQFTLRLGERPRAIVTTTPRPVQVIRDLLAEQTSAKNPAGTTAVTRGSTFDNAKNLAKTFLHKIVAKFKGTRLGEQELNGAVLDDAPGALWKRDRIDRLRRETAPDLYRIVVAIDPAVSTGEESAETGIIVAGVGYDGHGYLLEDLSGRYQPEVWAALAIDAYDRYQANFIVAEKNNGGNLVEATIRAACRSQMMPPEPGEDRKVRKAMVPYQDVSASQGKETRAEPIAVFCEQGLIHHVWSHPARPEELVGGLPITKNPFTQLEDQQCTWDPNSGMASPDRIDAYVWAFSKLPIGVKRRRSDDAAPKPKTAEQEFAEARGF